MPLSTDGFVRFGANKSTTAIIPEHFKTALASKPSRAAAMPKEADPAKMAKKSSSQLQQELDQLNAEREARLQALLEKQKKRKEAGSYKATTASVAAPPPLSFGSSKRRRK